MPPPFPLPVGFFDDKKKAKAQIVNSQATASQTTGSAISV
jgi:hypothetical protein